MMPKILQDSQIFSAVIQTIAEKGYSRATTKLLAESAGISEVTLFRKFGSKKELVKQAVHYVISSSGLNDVVNYTGDVYSDLVRMVSTYQKAITLRGDFISAIILEASRDKDLRDLVEAPVHMFHSFGEILLRYQREGVLREEHPNHAIGSLLGAVMYRSLFSRVKRGDAVPEIDAHAHVKRFLEGRMK